MSLRKKSRRFVLAIVLCVATAAFANPARYSDSGPESQLADTLTAIGQGNFPKALQQVDALIKAYPNFRLAYLIRGELLLAQTKPLSYFGEGG